MLHRRRGGSGGDNGAAARAQQWQSACEGEGDVGAWCLQRRVRRVPWRCLYRPGRGGEAAPGGNGHSALSGGETWQIRKGATQAVVG
jgi:hypothetical protein